MIYYGVSPLLSDDFNINAYLFVSNKMIFTWSENKLLILEKAALYERFLDFFLLKDNPKFPIAFQPVNWSIPFLYPAVFLSI